MHILLLAEYAIFVETAATNLSLELDLLIPLICEILITVSKMFMSQPNLSTVHTQGKTGEGKERKR